jgi:hypothetical protein
LTKPLLFIFCLVLPFKIFGQNTFTITQNYEVKHHGTVLPIPFAGGINAALFQEMDVDGDGIEELIVWDINARQINAYKPSGDSFIHLPLASFAFPDDISGFMILADFDGDGKKDLFTSSPFGIKVYRNTTTQGSKTLQWTVASNFLRLDNGSNVQANILDVPLITDLDGDGDLDIVTFNFASGDYLEFYRNTSVERKGRADIDGFAFPVARWGQFEFCSCGQFSFGITCSGMPMGRVNFVDEDMRVQHAGGHSIIYEDFNGDGKRDLLMGQDECNSLYFLPNQGESDVAPRFDRFEQALPEYGNMPRFPLFHNAYLQNDQLLVSSHSSSNALSINADFSRNIFKLKKGAQPVPFLQTDMIDLGENSRPSFKGNKSNGELLVSANTLTAQGLVGKIFRYKTNVTSWDLTDEDYLIFSRLKFTDLQYLTYSNSSNITSHWVAGVDMVNSALRRRLYFLGNNPSSPPREVTVPVVGLGVLDHVVFFAYERKDFMLLAKQTGELALYEVSWSELPTLRLRERNFLGFIDNPGFRNLNVEVIPGEQPALYAVDQRGVMVYIPDFMNKSEREAVNILLDQGSSQSRLGRNTWITHVPEPFSNQVDLILGNTAGGIIYLKNETSQTGIGENLLIKIYPNPAVGSVQVITSMASTGRVVNAQGQVLLEGIKTNAGVPIAIDISYFPPGLYIVQVFDENGFSATQKLIIPY